MSMLFSTEESYEECSTFDPSLPPIFVDYNEQGLSNVQGVFPLIVTGQLVESTIRNKSDFVQHLLQGLGGVSLSDWSLYLLPLLGIWCTIIKPAMCKE